MYHIEHLTKTKTYPDVDLWAKVAGALEDLRGGVGRRAAPGGQVGVGAPEIGKSEVRDFYIHVLVEQEIFSFQVAMYDSPEMDLSRHSEGIN